MPGFVDVSNMSDLEIKRLGQADEGDYQPRRRKRIAPAPQIGFSVSDVWAAACAADRVNGGYFKEFVYEWDEAARQNNIVKRKNRELMMEFLYNPERILVEDVERGEQVRAFLQNDLTFRSLKGQLTEFDSSTAKCLAVTVSFLTVSHRYELAVIACLPSSAARAQQRQETDARIKFAQGGHVGVIGQKVQLNAEVLSAVYSKEFNIYWIRCITDTDQIIVFSNKQSFDVGTTFTVQGKVKAHRENNLTQLNYVKVL
jgi:hypothetical protein